METSAFLNAIAVRPRPEPPVQRLYHGPMSDVSDSRQRGFTWIELVMVIAVVAILAGMAIPGMQDTALKKQVKEGMALADLAKTGVQAAYALTGAMPTDNATAGLPPGDKIVGNLVSNVTVDGGAITLTYGNNASKLLRDKHVTLRPAVVPGEPSVPIAWVCHDLAVPSGMEITGRDLTDLPPNHLPVDCRGPK
jgi:type IV pilus assembly protein PilA